MRRYVLAALFLLLLPTPVFAADSYQVNHGATVDITEHGECRTVTNNHASGAPLFIPTKTAPEWSSFYGATIAGVTIEACSACSVTPGSQSFTTAGSHNFVVPCYNTLTVRLWGGGGGGGGSIWSASHSAYNGTAGGNSTFQGMTAGGGGGGQAAYGSWGQNGRAGGTAGTASGGTTNTPGIAGGAGQNWGSSPAGGNGGASPNGGTGGIGGYDWGAAPTAGTAPGAGGGGAGSCDDSWSNGSGGGGGGGYVQRVYSAGGLTVGQSLSATVGAAGLGKPGECGDVGGNGAVGRVTFTWN
ncbi:hypothetical protein [Hyphomicrobium sp.]|uniref:hypothetical protein n=1 Tax=Hyphomicrobium sp. TaxID=82 RepID=UPI0025BEF91D|nr:hypothetical protein [Hyphomicrobium sp.]MCC7250453.1 hypothetical protein [Hyphomicrobium sp.]